MARPADSPGREEGRDRSASALQALIFILLGPILAVLAVWAIMMITTGGPSDTYGYPIVFIFSFFVCATTALINDVLSRFVPIEGTAVLAPVIGAWVAVGPLLCFCLGGMPVPPPELLLLAAGAGALNTGACSLLAYVFCPRKA